MRRAGVIGWPLATSLSPQFQQAALDALGIEARFEAWPTAPSELAARLDGMRRPDCAGACVTVPHKEAVMAALDEIDATALEIGAVNWIIRRGDKLIGYNTDSPGFVAALRARHGFEFADKRALVFGAGGAARAVIYGLRGAGASAAAIVNRTAASAVKLVERFQTAEFKMATAISLEDAARQTGAQFDLIVNASSVGMTGEAADAELPLDGAADLITNRPLVYDLVYSPPQTPFLTQLAPLASDFSNGLSMLIYQGAAGFEIMFNQTPPIDAMFAAIGQSAG